MTDRLPVFIPLASPRGDGRICHIEAHPTSGTSTSSGFDPSIAALADVELQNAGQVALDAARSLGRPNGQGFRFTKPKLRKIELHCLNRLDAAGLTATNSASAELGLTLAFLHNALGGRTKAFFATGALTGESGTASPSTGSVSAVSEIPQKIEACATWLEKHLGHPWGKQIALFTPEKSVDGRPFAEAYGEDIADLQRRAQAVGVEIRPHHIANLAEAHAHLDPHPLALDSRELLARIGAGTLAAATACAVGFAVWASTPFEMEFKSTGTGLLANAHPSALEVNPSTGAIQNRDACLDSKLRAVLSAHEAMAVEARSLRPIRFGANHAKLLMIVAGEDSGARAFSNDSFSENEILQSDAENHITFRSARFLAPPAEIMRVYIVSRKVLAFDVAEIQTQLNQIWLTNSAGQSRLDLTTALVSQLRWATHIETEFRVVDGLNACSGHQPAICDWTAQTGDPSTSVSLRNFQTLRVDDNALVQFHTSSGAKRQEVLILRDQRYIKAGPEPLELQEGDTVVLLASDFDLSEELVAEVAADPLGSSRGSGPALAYKTEGFQSCTIEIEVNP